MPTGRPGVFRSENRLTRCLHPCGIRLRQLEGKNDRTTGAVIDLADLGPGIAWAFEFDENGQGRLLEGNSSFDLYARAAGSYGCI